MTTQAVTEGTNRQMRRRNSRPYHQRGRPEVTEERKTSVDPPDRRLTMVDVPTLSPKSVQSILQYLRVDPRLRSTDLWFRRWAATPGAGVKMPTLAIPRLVFTARDPYAPALNNRDCYLVDIAVRTAPNWSRTFALLWYRSERTVSEIAEILRIKHRREVYQERELVLAYFLGRLAQMGFEMASWDPDEGTTEA